MLAGKSDNRLVGTFAILKVSFEGVKILNCAFDAARNEHGAGLPSDFCPRQSPVRGNGPP
jgi:hypothetical protein